MARRAKTSRQQQRRKARFEPRDRLLIVCEGAKTEKHYFEDARQALGIHRGQAEVEIYPGDGSNPKNIIETARKLKAEAVKEGNAFSSVWCVFNRDEHAHYQQSIERAAQLKMNTITSVPCFEYWILLHFRNHTAPYAKTGDRTPCACCLHDVQQVWPDYKKTLRQIYSTLKPRLDDARQRAQQRLAAAQADGSDNPSTEIHLLLDALEALKHAKTIGS